MKNECRKLIREKLFRKSKTVYGELMVKFGSKDSRPRLVLLSSIATSLVLLILFLFGAISTNALRGGLAYTQVDMAAGSIFVFVITMIISLSLWPRVMDWLEKQEKGEVIPK